jgi:hypothetical protein
MPGRHVFHANVSMFMQPAEPPLLMTAAACRMVLRAHKAALHAQQAFWRVMTHTSVTSEEIVCAMVQLENSKSKADRTYQTVLERYPTNVKVGLRKP